MSRRSKRIKKQVEDRINHLPGLFVKVARKRAADAQEAPVGANDTRCRKKGRVEAKTDSSKANDVDMKVDAPETPSSGTWSCGECTLVNKYPHLACIACGSPCAEDNPEIGDQGITSEKIERSLSALSSFVVESPFKKDTDAPVAPKLTRTGTLIAQEDAPKALSRTRTLSFVSQGKSLDLVRQLSIAAAANGEEAPLEVESKAVDNAPHTKSVDDAKSSAPSSSEYPVDKEVVMKTEALEVKRPKLPDMQYNYMYGISYREHMKQVQLERYRIQNSLYGVDFKKQMVAKEWKGLTRVQEVPLSQNIRNVLLDLKREWIDYLTNIVFEYLGDEFEQFADYLVYIKVDRLKALVGKTKSPLDEERVNEILQGFCTQSLRMNVAFPRTPEAMAKYRRPHPPKVSMESKNVTELKAAVAKHFKSTLWPYQMQTCAWMKSVEDEVAANGGYELGHDDLNWPKQGDSGVYYDYLGQKITDQAPAKRTLSFSGGVVADQMGLGKTLTALALCFGNRPAERITTPVKANAYNYYTDATLIVCPSHLVNQWKEELVKHCKSDYKLHMVTTMREHAALTYQDCLDADFIIASVQFFQNPKYRAIAKKAKTLRSEENFKLSFKALMKKNDPMSEAKPNFGLFYWRRFILDEGHELFSAKQAKATYSIIEMISDINSQFRWYLSGTPFPDPVLSTRGCLRFLRASINGERVFEGTSYTDREIVKFCEISKKEDDDSDRDVLEYLGDFTDTLLSTPTGGVLDHFLYSHLFCRSTKATVGISYKVPDYKNQCVAIDMHPIEAGLYKYSKEAPRNRMLMCGHPQTADDCEYVTRKDKDKMLSLSTLAANKLKQLNGQKAKWEQRIQSLGYSIDSIKRNLETYQSANYFHHWSEADRKKRIKALKAREKEIRIEIDDLQHKIKNLNVPISFFSQKFTFASPDIDKYGSKLAHLIRTLRELCAGDNRIILFTQHSRLLTMVQTHLSDPSVAIKYQLVSGNVMMRNRAIQAFYKQSDIKIIMLSLDNAASGTNLTQATHVILLDPILGTREESEAIESQAIGRAYRQGQERKLTVIRYVTQHSIEFDLYLRNVAPFIAEQDRIAV